MSTNFECWMCPLNWSNRTACCVHTGQLINDNHSHVQLPVSGFICYFFKSPPPLPLSTTFIPRKSSSLALGILAATAIRSPCDLTCKHHKCCRGHSNRFNLQKPSKNARPILTKSYEKSLGDQIASQLRSGHTSCCE